MEQKDSHHHKQKTSRRSFIRHAAFTAIAAHVGLPVVYSKYFPKGLSPIGLADGSLPADLVGKSPKLRVLNDRPVNAETPAHLLDGELTANELFFVRNNGIPPSTVDADTWVLTVEGESAQQRKSYTIGDLRSKFKNHTLNITLECGGNGRSEYNPPAKGNQWSTGAVGCAAWTGVRLKDVLSDVGIKDDAVYIGYYGADTHLSGDASKEAISRGVPIRKALEDESMIAWAMNGEDMPLLNGHPLRLVFGGYPASCSGKWLQRIVVRNKVHDGQKMTGSAYRVPCDPVAPGAKVEAEDMCIIEDMPVKSLITYPKTGAMISKGQVLPLRGHAWTAAEAITAVEYSYDFGKSWQPCQVGAVANRYQWYSFTAEVQLPGVGYYEVWARATDSNGDRQPVILPGWNPKGYLNNACHRIAVKVR